MATQLAQASSAGEIVRSRQVSGFILTETAYRAGFRARRHSHELGYFFTVLDGDFTEALGSTMKTYGPAALAYRPAGLAHAHACGGGGRCFNIYPVELERFQECARSLRVPTDVHGALLPWLVTRLYREFVRPEEGEARFGASGSERQRRGPFPGAALAMEGLALEILAEATRPSACISPRRSPQWLEEARELLHARFCESITVAQVAQCVGVNSAYLARDFRERCRCTLGDYVRRLRVEFACRLLCTSDLPLVAIALDAGFVDQSHFTKTFKRLVGMTPAQFRSASHPR